MKEKIRLDESSEEFKALKDEWMKKAKTATIETLPAFLEELTQKYSHDYGTICHAVSMASIAAAWAVAHSPQGGITGFQAGYIMWQFIKDWNYSSNKTGLRLIDYDNFLYPQYEDKYQKTLSPQIWQGIQQEAQAKMDKADADYAKYLLDLEQYKIDIAKYVEKYPDYYDNKEHYDPLGIGNGDQWDAEEKKKADGFEFAPQPPYDSVNENSPVYRHWVSIVQGEIPFGYSIKEE